MMLTTNDYSIYLLLMSNIALLGAATIAILRLQRMVHRSEDFWKSPLGNALAAQNDGKKASRALTQELGVLGDKIDGLLQASATRSSDDIVTGLPLENAARMARQGASVEDLTRSCGLNVGEARLMKRLNAVPSRAKVNAA